jgi:hypothetical protein
VVATRPVWWPPHESWSPLASSSETLPHFQLVRERQMELVESGVIRDGDITRMPAWAPAGAVVAIAAFRSLAVWDVENDNIRTVGVAPEMTERPPAFVSDDEILVAGGSAPDTAFSVVDIHSGAAGHEEPGPHTGEGQDRNRPMSFAVSPDRTVAAVTFVDRQQQPHAYQTIFYRTNDWSRMRAVEDPGRNLAFVGDGTRYATGSEDGRVIAIVETESGRELARIPIAASAPPAFNRDGSLGAAPDSRGVHVFKVADGQEIAFLPFFSGQDRSSTPVAWDPLERFTAFQDRTFVHFWNPRGGPRSKSIGVAEDTKIIDDRMIVVRPGAAGVAVSPDGKRVAVVNGDMISIFAINGPP